MHVRRYLWVALAATPLAGAAADETASPRGDARRGEALYVGTARMVNGGAPCLGCHGIAGHGLARAASFGPDLSAVHEAYGVEALDSALADIPYPSMQPVYNGHALTPQERADVVAFLGEASGKPPPQLGGGYAAGVAGAMALFLGAFVWIGKRGETRRARATAAATKRGTP